MNEHKDPSVNYVDQSIIQYKEGVHDLQHTLPDVTGKYMAFTEACFKDGMLSKKEKQLIALGISMVTQDEYCMIYHTKGAIDNGATESEIAETIGVSVALGGGAAFAQGVTLVMDTFHHYTNTLQ